MVQKIQMMTDKVPATKATAKTHFLDTVTRHCDSDGIDGNGRLQLINHSIYREFHTTSAESSTRPAVRVCRGKEDQERSFKFGDDGSDFLSKSQPRSHHASFILFSTSIAILQ